VPPPTGSPPFKLALSEVALHPSTVASSAAGKAEAWFKLSHAGKVTLILEQFATKGCAPVDRRTLSSPAGLSHVSLKSITGRTKLTAAHYRVVVTATGLPSHTLHLVVSTGWPRRSAGRIVEHPARGGTPVPQVGSGVRPY
jgi:hypothetical protein